MTIGTVQEKTITPGQVKELGSALIEALPLDMQSGVAQGWIGNKQALKKNLQSMLVPQASGVQGLSGSFIRYFAIQKELIDEGYRLDQCVHHREGIDDGRGDTGRLVFLTEILTRHSIDLELIANAMGRGLHRGGPNPRVEEGILRIGYCPPISKLLSAVAEQIG